MSKTRIQLRWWPTHRSFGRLDRYIIGKFLGTYFFAIILIISIAVVFDYNENIDRFTQNNAPLSEVFGTYYVNFIPYYANLFSSLFIFISVIFFTTKLADNSEIIAMLAAGTSMNRIWRCYMFAAALIAGLTYYLSSEVIPQGSVRRLAFENQYKRRDKNPVIAENIQMQVDTGVIALIERFDGPFKTGYHFSLDKFEHKKLILHLTANTMVYDSISDEKYHWKLNDVTIRDMRGSKDVITHIPQLDSLITIEPSDLLTIRNNHETMTNSQLLDYIEKQQMRGGTNTKAYEVEYQKRIASPFSCFILATIGLSLSARKRKGGMGMALGVGLALSALYILLQTISATFALNAGLRPVVAVWIPNLLYIFIALYLYAKAPR